MYILYFSVSSFSQKHASIYPVVGNVGQCAEYEKSFNLEKDITKN